MKSRFLVSAACLTLIAAVTAVSLEAGASKYKKMRETAQQQVVTVGSAEQTRSMTDCMEFSANHVSRGHAADRDMFKKQFGAAIAASGQVYTYGYDEYTNIILDCSGRSCHCRCLTR